MRLKFLVNTGSYKKDQTYEINKRMAIVLIHIGKAIPAADEAPEGNTKQLQAAPENRMMTASVPKPKAPPKKPAAKKTPARAPKKNEYETKTLTAKE